MLKRMYIVMQNRIWELVIYKYTIASDSLDFALHKVRV